MLTIQGLGKRFRMTEDEVRSYLKADPTSRAGQPGKYSEWILSRIHNKTTQPNAASLNAVTHFLMLLESRGFQGIPVRNSGKPLRTSAALKVLKSMASFLSNSDVRGEWWIQDGSALYADGDYGDMGHEGLVLESLGRDLLDLAESEGFPTSHHGGWDSRELLRWADETYLPQKVEELRSEGKDVQADELQQTWDSSIQEALESIAVGEWGFDSDAWTVLFEERHVRDFAMRRWGWKAVRGPNVETWTFTAGDLKNIVQGLADAYPALYEDEENQLPVDEINSQTYRGEHFSIDVAIDGSYYPEVPWPVLAHAADTGNMSLLHSYRHG